MLTDEKGTVLDIVKGENDRVAFSERTINQIAKNKKTALILYHNHPGGNSFSQGDISVLLTNPEIEEMVAVGHNGRVYSLKIGKGKRPGLKDFYYTADDLYYKYKNQGDKAVKLIAKKHGWTYTVHGGKQ